MGMIKELLNDFFVGIGGLTGWRKRSSVVSPATSPDGGVISSGKLHFFANDGLKRNVSNAFFFCWAWILAHNPVSSVGSRLQVDWGRREQRLVDDGRPRSARKE